MKINTLHLTNFLGIGESKIALDDRGLVLVQGENLDDASANSNGSGKSSLIDGIFWTLYGKTARGLSGNDVINEKAGKQCVGRIEGIVDGQVVVIERWRKAKGYHKPSGVSITVNGVDKTQGTDTLTQIEIEKVVGSSENVFRAAIYSGQEDMVDIPKLTDRELKNLIEKAANIDMIEDAYEIARSQLADVSLLESQAQQKHNDALLSLERANNELDRTNTRLEAWKHSHAITIAEQEDRVRELVSKAKAKSAEIKKADPDSIKSKIASEETREAEADQAIADLDAELLSLSGAQNTADAVRKKLEAARQEHTRTRTEAIAAKNAFDLADKRLKTASDRVGQPCDECGKPIDEEDMASVIENRKAARDEALKKAHAAKDAYADAGNHASAVERELEAALKKVPDTTKILNKKNDQRNIAGDARNRVRTLTSELNALSGMESDLNTLKARARDANAQLDRLKKETNPHTDEVKEREEAVSDAEADLHEAIEAHRIASVNTLIAKRTAEVFGPKGVRAHILDTVTPFLNARTAHYLGTLSDGSLEAIWSTLTEDRKGDLKEKFSITVTKYGGRSFAGLSGGEKRKVRLATMLALQDLVASRATKPFNIWIGDEIDDALDSAGLERLMTLLEMKAREKGTVLIVSHNDLNAWVTDTVTVTMENETARVSGCLVL